MLNIYVHVHVVATFQLISVAVDNHFNNAGEVERSDNHSIQRLTFLNSSSHNHMRITRILKSLGELNYEHLKAPFVRFVLHEAIVRGTLENTLNSCMKYWVETIREESERDSLWLLAENLIAKYY